MGAPIGNKNGAGNHKPKSEKHRQKIAAALSGKPKSAEHKHELSAALMGNTNKAGKYMDSVGYAAYHYRVKQLRGKPSLCEYCGATKGFFQWANKDHKNYEDPYNYVRLCVSCHEKYDFEVLGVTRAVRQLA